MNVRPYQPGDIGENFHRPRDLVRPLNNVLMAHGSFVRSIEVDEGVIAVVGMQIRWPGVADVWAVVSDDARGHGLQLTRAVKHLLKQFATELGLWRVSTLVKAGVEENQRWIEALGFVYESTEVAAGPDGRDLLRYVTWTTGENPQ